MPVKVGTLCPTGSLIGIDKPSPMPTEREHRAFRVDAKTAFAKRALPPLLDVSLPQKAGAHVPDD